MTTTINSILIGSSWEFYKTRNDLDRFFKDLYDPNKIVYVRISDKKSARCGSIGIATPTTMKGLTRDKWPTNPKRRTSYYSSDFRLELELGEGKSVTRYNFSERGIEWLPDYKGPTTWCFKTTPAEVNVKKFYDCLGDEIKLGDFGVYADTDGTLFYGTVTKISKVGIIYVTNIKTPGKYQREFRLRRGNQFSIMHKDIFQKLMLIKLAQ